MTATTTRTIPHLVVRAAGRACALPVHVVIETMRPRALEALPDAPAFVAGLALVRGEGLPVVALAALLGEAPAAAGRWVVVRAGARRVVLAVDEVAGLEPLAAAAELPPLLRGAHHDAVAAIARLDDGLLLVLEASRLLPAAPEAPAGTAL